METEILEQPDVQEEKKEKFKSFSDKFKKHFNIFQEKFKKHMKYNWQIYLLFLPAFIWMVMFVFVPFISNVLMSFQDYSVSKGVFGSKFIGFKNYIDFFYNGWLFLPVG